jgi:hypothetical protein
MANQLSTTGASSTGGQTQATATGLRHTANPNIKPAATSTVEEAAIPGYIQKFEQWADQTLATRVPTTGETVTMDKVQAKFPDLADKLKATLKQIESTQGTPQQAQAVQNYVMLAVAGVQALAQTSKNQYGTVQTNLGIGTQSLAQLKALSRTPAGKKMLQQELGL